MEKMTPFSLFLRQALRYPLESPFLPPVEYVLKDFSYANGTKIGLLEVETMPIVWNVYKQHPADYADALLIAEYLDADGFTIDETPQNIWRIPLASEIIGPMTKAWQEGDRSGGIFAIGGGWLTSSRANYNQIYCVSYLLELGFCLSFFDDDFVDHDMILVR